MRTWLFWILLCVSCTRQPPVSINEGTFREGQECFKIQTPSATYLYQKEAGGFSNILDSNGTDWIQFHKSDETAYPQSAGSDYRGLPNLVFRSEDGGAGHPGFSKMTSEQIASNQIKSISNSGKWQWTWTFFENYADLLVEKTDTTHAYWFLYEGPIAGRFSPSSHYWGTDISGPSMEQPDLVKGPEGYATWHTVYFGDTDYDQVLFVKQLERDTLSDLYTYMGNSREGNASKDGMVVFGFGRGPKATPLLTGRQKFRMGFYNGKIEDLGDHQHILSYIENLTP